MEPMVNIALRAARKAGNLIARASDDLTRLRFEAKGKADFVTEVDLASEQEILYNLKKTYPDHAFICEESGRTGPEDASPPPAPPQLSHVTVWLDKEQTV